MTLEDGLLDILVCPIDRRGLLYFPEDALLYNPRLRRMYRIEDGIPLLLASEAVRVPDDEHERLMLARQLVHGEPGPGDEHGRPG